MNSTSIKLLAAVVFCMVSQASASDEELPVAADEYVYCTVCHGVQLMGNPIIKAPRLSGMEVWYTELQMRNFKNRTRGLHADDPFGYEMQPMAEALTDEQIREVSLYVNATKSPPPAATVEGDAERGKALYTSCAACHGADGKGNEALRAPDLTTTDDWYLVIQLKNYKSGSRGSAPGDIYGAQMRASVQPLSDDQAIVDVVSYINTLQEN